jgi:hypothetical protein
VSELAADGIPVVVTCRVLKIAPQPYYRWLARPVTAAELTEAYRANALFDAHLMIRSSGTGSWWSGPRKLDLGIKPYAAVVVWARYSSGLR